MIKLQYLDAHIEKTLLAKNEEERKNHEPSGKLSAGKLGAPLQHQVLHTIGVPSKELEEYTIRKFARGNDVEDWLVGFIPGLINKQKFVEYRDCIGFVDAIADMRDWNLEQYGTIPHEIKSVTNAKFKRLQKGDGADDHHALQGALYALALGTEWFAINYVASDDYRVETILLETRDFKDRIDEKIDAYNKQMEMGVVPQFEALYKWQENIKYNSYPEWAELTPMEIELKLQEEYPEQYKKLKGTA